MLQVDNRTLDTVTVRRRGRCSTQEKEQASLTREENLALVFVGIAGSHARRHIDYVVIAIISFVRASGRQPRKLGRDSSPRPADTTLTKKGRGQVHVECVDVDKSASRGKKVCLFLFAVVLLSILAWLIQPGGDVVQQRLASFLHSVERLNKSFISQDARTWAAIRQRGKRHVTSPDPIQPAVFLLASVPGTEDATDCLAKSLANAFLAGEKNSPAVIRGEALRERDGHEAKKEMDDILNRNLSSLSNHDNPLPVAVIEDIHHLLAPSPFLFYSYCDNQDAPVRRAVFVFTVKMPTAPKPGLSPVEKEGFVITYLTQNLWTVKKHSQYSEDAVEALVTRLSDVTILVAKETTSNLAQVCKTLQRFLAQWCIAQWCGGILFTEIDNFSSNTLKRS